MYFIYILRCVDSSLYCGYTTDVENRIKAHMGERPGGAKYTKSHPPLCLAALWHTDSKESALRLEAVIKKLKKSEKERLISDSDAFGELFGSRLDTGAYERNEINDTGILK
ncbi:MAG: GIY-YIG nuclease family protein [Clostridia bacterium]|nr:GIY-YIG nuclease family protein [Clostridia bacterium]